MPLLESAAMVVGGTVASAVDVFTEALKQMTADPRALARDIALQLIMFTLTTVILGSLYHYLVLKPREVHEVKLAEARRASLMEPFRRMLVMRIASVHGSLFDALTQFKDWSGNWGRPRVRTLSGNVAHLCAELSSAVISNAELLASEEHKAIGRYSSLLFALQGKLEEIEKMPRALDQATVGALRGVIAEANASINQIADALDAAYKTQMIDLLWDEDDRAELESHLLTPLDNRVAAIARRAAEAAAPPPAMAAE